MRRYLLDGFMPGEPWALLFFSNHSDLDGLLLYPDEYSGERIEMVCASPELVSLGTKNYLFLISGKVSLLSCSMMASAICILNAGLFLNWTKIRCSGFD